MDSIEQTAVKEWFLIWYCSKGRAFDLSATANYQGFKATVLRSHNKSFTICDEIRNLREEYGRLYNMGTSVDATTAWKCYFGQYCSTKDYYVRINRCKATIWGNWCVSSWIKSTETCRIMECEMWTMTLRHSEM